MRRNRWRRRPHVLRFLPLLVLVAVVWRGCTATVERPDAEPLGEGIWQVRRVVDGDTIDLERTIARRVAGQMTQTKQSARVRLMGVDTPETVKPDHPIEPWGPEASEFTRQFVAGGSVRLQLDKERLDKYGRLLGYLWVGQQMLNEELLREGLAKARLTFRYSAAIKRRFRIAQDEAQKARRGIWSETR